MFLEDVLVLVLPSQERQHHVLRPNISRGVAEQEQTGMFFKEREREGGGAVLTLRHPA